MKNKSKIRDTISLGDLVKNTKYKPQNSTPATKVINHPKVMMPKNNEVRTPAEVKFVSKNQITSPNFTKEYKEDAIAPSNKFEAKFGAFESGTFYHEIFLDPAKNAQTVLQGHSKGSASRESEDKLWVLMKLIIRLWWNKAYFDRSIEMVIELNEKSIPKEQRIVLILYPKSWAFGDLMRSKVFQHCFEVKYLEQFLNRLYQMILLDYDYDEKTLYPRQRHKDLTKLYAMNPEVGLFKNIQDLQAYSKAILEQIFKIPKPMRLDYVRQYMEIHGWKDKESSTYLQIVTNLDKIGK